jgi:hypothetical protein
MQQSIPIYNDETTITMNHSLEYKNKKTKKQVSKKHDKQEHDKQDHDKQDHDKQDHDKQEHDKQEHDKQDDQLIIQTFRYTFSQEFTEQMSYFAKIHQFDDIKTFKEAWKSWSEEDKYIASLINNEQKILIEQGYDGNIIDKMFKSARYYYRKKKEIPTTPPQERREYIGCSIKILEIMDVYIKTKFLENTIKTNDNKIKTTISPAHAYNEFCNIYKQSIIDELELLEQQPNCKLDSKILNEKIKKTFKNRYFIQSKLCK